MQRSHALFVAILACLRVGQATAFTLWNDTRVSALLPDGTVVIRTENIQGPGVANTILFAENGVQEITMNAVTDGPSTLETAVPGPVSARRHYGFRLVQNGAIDLLPVRLAAGGPATPDDLTFVSSDPTGDEIFGRNHLDLVACSIGRDETRLYAALTNVGGGFPVSSGLTFFSYLLGIKDPAVSSPDTLFGMIHTVTAPGIIEPGLYQINGDGVGDLVKIGEITATEWPAANALLLSCELADLEANTVFQSWYDPADPRLEAAAFSQRITLLTGAQEADSTPGGTWHLREVAFDPGPNQLPQLSDLTVPPPGPGVFASVFYNDADGHCPVIAELVIDDAEIYPLKPNTLDYSVPVEYRTDGGLPQLMSGEWTRVTARFSDNVSDVVELTIAVSEVGDGHPQRPVRAAPNPFFGRTELAFELRRAQPVSLTIYDLAGHRVRTVVAASLPAGRHAPVWDGRDETGRPQSAGVYLYRLRSQDHNELHRLTLMR